MFVGAAEPDREEMARSLARARAASGGSAFSTDGRYITALGDVEDTFKADLSKFVKESAENQDKEEKDGEAADASDGAANAGGKGSKVRRPWRVTKRSRSRPNACYTLYFTNSRTTLPKPFPTWIPVLLLSTQEFLSRALTHR